MRILFCLAILHSVVMQADQLPARGYTSADGLPMSRMNDIMDDRQGFLWFASDQGLTRFDGYEFRTFGLEDGLRSKVVSTLIQDQDGTYWLGSNKGLIHFDGRHFEPVPAVQDYVTVLFQDSRKRLWCGTSKTLFLIDRSVNAALPQAVPLQHQPGADPYVVTITEDAAGVIWASSQATLYKLKDGVVTRAFTAAEGIPGRISSLLADDRGRVWLGTWDGLCLLNTASDQGPIIRRIWHRTDGLASNIIHVLYRTSGGTIWALTEHGLSSWQEDSDTPVFRIRRDAQGWLSGSDEAVSEDRRGSLWISTETHGVIRVALNGITTLGMGDGLLSNKIRDLFPDRNGDMVVATRIDSPDAALFNRYRGQILYRMRDNELHAVSPGYPKDLQKPGWGERQIVLQDHLGEWWMTSEQGLFRFPAVPLEKLPETSPLAHYTDKDGLSGNDVWRVFEDARGDIWIGTMNGGVFRWQRRSSQFQRIGGPSPSASAFENDDAGNLWIGFWSRAELGRFRNGRLEKFSAANGLSRGWVTEIFKDHLGRIWVTTTGGLSRIDNPAAESPTIQNYASIPAFSSHRVECITEDRSGVIYVGTDIGLEAFNPKTGGIRHFGMIDGLPDDEVLSAFCDKNGILWFGSHGGLARFQQVNLSVPRKVPLRIVGLQIGGHTLPVEKLGETQADHLRLNPGENVLQVDYTDLAFGSAGQLRFQYLLDGTHEDWSAPSKDRSLHFVGLAPGSYKLSIRAVDMLDQPVSDPVTAAFRVMPQFWQTWWFEILIVAFATAIGVVIHRYRISRLIAVQNLRSRIAFDLHDEVGSGLTQIAIWSELARGNKRPDGQDHLEQIATSSRSLVDTIGDIIWTVNPQRDSVRELVQRVRYFASEICTACDINLIFKTDSSELDREASSEVRRDVFLIAKEAIHNAVRHAQCSQIEVRFCILANRLELHISDNGRGLPTSWSDGNGLGSMRQRAKALRGKIEWHANPQGGTHVCLQMPLESRYIKTLLRKLPR